MSQVFFKLLLALSLLWGGVPAVSQDANSTVNASPELFLQIGHSADVASIAFTPDGKQLATGSIDGTIKLWDIRSGTLLRTIVAPSDITSIDFSPDGQIFAAAGHGGNTIGVWNTTDGELVRTLSGHDGFVYSVAFSPDGKRIASGSADKMLKLWDAHSGRVLQTLIGHEGIVNQVVFSPDGSRLASAGMDNTIMLWDTTTGTLVRTLGGGHESGVYAIDFSPDGRQLVSSGGDYSAKAEIRLWSIETGQVLRSFKGHDKLVASVAFSPDGKRIASGSWDKTFRLWDAASGVLLRTVPATSDLTRTTGNKGRLLVWYPVAFSPDGKSLAFAARDRAARLIDPVNGEVFRTLGGRKGQVYDAAFSPDGRQIVSASDYGNVRLWSTATGELTHTFNSGGERIIYAAAFSSDGRRIVSGGSQSGKIDLWDVESGALLRDFSTHFNYLVPALTVSLDGKTVVGVSWDGASWKSAVEIWDAATGTLLRSLAVPENATVYDVAFSPDGKTVASGHRDQTIKLWDSASGNLLQTLTGHAGLVHRITYSPDGRTLATESSDKTIKLWNAESGALLRTLEIPDEGSLPIAFSPDSRRLAWGGRTTIKLWDVNSGRALSTLIGHNDSVTAVMFSPAGSKLLSGSYDTTLRLWNLDNARLLASMMPMPQVADATLDARPIEIGAKAIEIGAKAADLSDNEWFVATPEGYFDCSTNAARYVKWRINDKLYPAERYYRKFRRPDFVQKALRGETIAAPQMTSEDIPPAAQFVSLKYAGAGQAASAQEIMADVEVRGRRGIKEVLVLVNGRPLPPESEQPIHTSDTPLNLPSRPIDIGAKPIEIGSKAIEIGSKPIEIGAKPGGEGAASTPVQPDYRFAKRYTFRVPLPIGASEIRLRAVAYDEGDLGSSPTEILLQNSAARPVPGRLYAVCIGVSKYQRGATASTLAVPAKGVITNLQYPAKDAASLAHRLEKEGAPLYEHVEVRTLINEQATLAGVRTALKWLQQSVRPGQVDTAVLCLSGHGISDLQGRYFFPLFEFDPQNYRETSLTGSELQEELGGKLRAKNVFLFVDTCHSGALTGARSDDLNFEVNASGVYMMASSAATQYSYESSAWGHGAFTLALLRSLANKELARTGLIHFNVLTYAVPDEIAKLLKAAGQSEDAMAPVVPLEGRYLDAPVANAR